MNKMKMKKMKMKKKKMMMMKKKKIKKMKKKKMMMIVVALLDMLAVLQYSAFLSIKQSIHITTLLMYGEDELRRRLVAPGYDS